MAGALVDAIYYVDDIKIDAGCYGKGEEQRVVHRQTCVWSEGVQRRAAKTIKAYVQKRDGQASFKTISAWFAFGLPRSHR